MAITLNKIFDSSLDIGKEVFSHLSLIENVRNSSVCKLWQQIVGDDNFWTNIATARLKLANIDLKRFPDCHAVFSEKTLMGFVRKFANSTQLHEKGKFECFFPFNPTCSIAIEFGYGNILNNAPLYQNHICVFMGPQPIGIPETKDNSIVYGETLQTLFKYQLDISRPEVPQIFDNRLQVLDSEYSSSMCTQFKGILFLLFILMIVSRFQ